MVKKNMSLEIDNLWCITEEKYSREANKYFEGLFTQGNGYMHVRGSFEEGLQGAVQDEEYLRMPANVTLEKPRHPKTKWGTFIPGIVGKHPVLKEEIINLPYFLGMEFKVADEKLDMELSTVRDYKRWLDLRDGCLHRSFIWETESGVKLKLEYLRFISMADKHLCLQQVHIEMLSGEGVLTIECGINTGVRTNGYNHFQKVLPSFMNPQHISIETVTDGGNRVLMMSDVDSSEEISLERLFDGKRTLFTGGKRIKNGDCLVLQKATSIATDRDMEEGTLLERGYKSLMVFRDEGWEEVYKRHARAWKENWLSGDIAISGDDEAQLVVRTYIYHLIRSNCDNDPRIAICAKGYAGEAYFGRYFWDTEINMLPFFIHTNPAAAKNLITFRYNTLEGARKNAREYGYAGAKYAWESSITGEEQCPCWQYADHEVHITADIVYAMLHYVNGTGDTEFIRNFGIDIMVETSRYWVRRVDWNKKGYYELLGVMGPDEYLPMTRNNAFTNQIVKFSLNKTVEHLEGIKREDLRGYMEMETRLGLKLSEIEKFKEVGEKLLIPFDEGTEIIPQSEDFESYADLDFSTIWKDRTRPFGHFISQEKNYRSKALKQADALLLMLLFPGTFTREQFVKTYDYYEPITTHDSSLSAAVHGIIAAWIGRRKEAEKFLKRVMDIDMSMIKQGAAEGIHIANCGGLWQMIVYGFAGLKSAMWENEIKLEPNLPEKWEKLEFKVFWRGKRHKIIITKENFEVSEINEIGSDCGVEA